MVDKMNAAASKKPSVLGMVGGVVGAAVGYAVGAYATFALLIPAGLAILVGWILAKSVPAANKPMVAASAVQAGHGLWMLFGIVMLSQYGPALIDPVILVGGAVWLALRPSIMPVALLACYQVAGLAVNGIAISATTLNTPMHKALVVHILLRVAALALMVYGLIAISKQNAAASAVVDM
jgi:hypothetical protein